jgi:hypothetical protein
VYRIIKAVLQTLVEESERIWRQAEEYVEAEARAEEAAWRQVCFIAHNYIGIYIWERVRILQHMRFFKWFYCVSFEDRDDGI